MKLIRRLLLSIIVSTSTAACMPPQYETQGKILNDKGKPVDLGPSNDIVCYHSPGDSCSRPLTIPINVWCGGLERKIAFLKAKQPTSAELPARLAEYQKLRCDLVY